ncbi:hypothetical protein scyTo_0019690 [Scyliorhinus torazame]|uniref:Uncharacterized protein n=1 Tax=Scyliorhinus torazame TaxID=75743 RepID=A0A401PP72_SCYTO|nr:hypothetical protein [Scyliorhinus torazame]
MKCEAITPISAKSSLIMVPASVSYTVNRGAKLPLIIGCAGGILAILLLIIVLTRLKFKASAGNNRNSVESAQREEPVTQRPSEQIAAYASLNFREGRGPSKPRHEKEPTIYSQTKHGTDNSLSLSYATVQTSSKNNENPRQREERTVYSQTKQRGGDNKLTYAALQFADSRKPSKGQQDKGTVYAGVKVTKNERS